MVISGIAGGQLYLTYSIVLTSTPEIRSLSSTKTVLSADDSISLYRHYHSLFYPSYSRRPRPDAEKAARPMSGRITESPCHRVKPPPHRDPHYWVAARDIGVPAPERANGDVGFGRNGRFFTSHFFSCSATGLCPSWYIAIIPNVGTSGRLFTFSDLIFLLYNFILACRFRDSRITILTQHSPPVSTPHGQGSIVARLLCSLASYHQNISDIHKPSKDTTQDTLVKRTAPIQLQHFP